MTKKILFYCGDGNSLVDFRGNLIQKFLKAKFNVVGVGPNISDSNLELLHSWGATFEKVSIKRKSANPFRALSSLISLIGIIHKQKPSHIFSYTHKPVLVGSFAGRICKVENIISLITGTGHLFDEENLFQKIRKKIGLFFFRIALFFSSHVIFQNPDDKKLFIDLRLVEPSKSSQVNGSGVDMSSYKFSQHPPSDIIFLCLARLIRSKGLIEYAHVAKAIKKIHPDVRFLLGGPGDEHQDSISVNEIKNSWYDLYGIEYLGHIKDVRSIIEKSSIYVLLSYNEGTPRSVLEAMSIGRPIITTDVSGCRETVKHGINGFLVPVKDVDSSIPYFLKIIDSDLKKMGLESRNFCEEKYDVNKVNNNIFKILEIYD